MNTLNNQQINPGNRVDFSRIRRFRKGGVPKYENTPGKLPYNWDWEGLNNAINGGGFGTASATSLAYNKTFTPQGDIKTVADLEASQDYRDFTDYVKANALTDPKAMEYLKNLDAKSRKAGATTGHLFDASGNLVQGWEGIYDKLRNDKKYGAYHYSAGKLPTETQDTPEVTEETTTVTEPPTTVNTTEFNTPQYLPKYQKSLPNTGYLHQIYRNNVDSINKQLGYALELKTPEAQSLWLNASVSSNYLAAQNTKKLIAENRALYQELANSTGDIAKANAAMLDYDLKVTNPALTQMSQGIADSITVTTNNLQNVMNLNMQSSVATGNLNQLNRVAGFNNRLNALSGAEAQTAAETASFLNNRQAVLKEHTLNEKMNEQAYNRKVNDIMASIEGQLAYQQYLNSATDAASLADQSSGVNLESLKSSMLDPANINVLGLTDEEVEVITDPQSDKADVIEIIKAHRADLDELSGSAASTWLNTYSGYMKDADKRWTDAQTNIALKKAILELGYNPYLSGTSDGVGVGTNWQNVYGGYFKKGGKVSDRWSKYLSYRAKVLDTTQRALAESQRDASKKLIRDLDALDRETLLLLRSIFK